MEAKNASNVSNDYSEEMKMGYGNNDLAVEIASFDRTEIYHEIWNHSIAATAQKYDVPYDKLRKAIVEADIPLPTQSFRTKVSMGKSAVWTPLPLSDKNAVSVRITVKDGMPSSVWSKEWMVSASIKKPEYIAVHRDLSFLPEEMQQKALTVAAGLKVHKRGAIHPVLEKNRIAFEKWEKEHDIDPKAEFTHDPYSRKNDEPPLHGYISNDVLPRVNHLLTAVFRGVEELGGVVNEDLSVEICGERVTFTVEESQKIVPHEETKQEKAAKNRPYYYARPTRKNDYLPTGKLTIIAFKGSFFREQTEINLEERVGDILKSLYMQAELQRQIHAMEQEALAAGIEAEKARRRRAELVKQERVKVKELLDAAERYDQAVKIRVLAAAIENKQCRSPEEAEWVTWAMRKAAWIDPVIDEEDELLGDYKRYLTTAAREEQDAAKTHYWW